MRKNLKKLVYVFIIFVISFYFNNVKILAASETYRIVTIFPFKSSFKIDEKPITYTRKSSYQKTNGQITSSTQEANFSGIGIYGITSKNINTLTGTNAYFHWLNQVYCIEPGSQLATTTYGKSNEKDNYIPTQYNNYTSRYVTTTNNEDKMRKIKAIFTFSRPPVAGFVDKEYKDSHKNGKEYYFTKDYASSVYATQLLIWEIADGERTSFADPKPNNNVSNNSAYCKMHGCSGTNAESKLSPIKSEYDRIVKAVNRIFGSEAKSTNTKLGNFTLSTSDKSAENYYMTYDSGKYILTIADDYAKYYSVSSSDKNISISNNGKAITLTSSEPISSSIIQFKLGGADAPAAKSSIMNYTIECPSNKNKQCVKYLDALPDIGDKYEYESDVVYLANNGDNTSYAQDLVKVTPKSHNIYMKVTTPQYKLKIVKKGKKDESSTDEENLSGVQFELYDTDKKNKLTSTPLTTNNEGIATYNSIKKPGTYYIKEIKTAQGYNLKEAKINDYKLTDYVPITVSSGNTSDPATVTAYNYVNKFDLIKYSVDQEGNKTKLEDDCDKAKGAQFEVRDSNGKLICFKENSVGDYEYSSTSDASHCAEGEVSSIYTCDGEFSVEKIPGCEDGSSTKNYIVSEKSFAGNQIDSEPNKTINVCGADRAISFYNGFSGIEFQKKNEDGKLLKGGSFKLQMKKNGVYIDVAVLEIDEGVYKYDESSNNYEINTLNGTALISDTPVGEYRMVEIVAPEGYDTIKPSDSKATVIISDKNKDGYYQMEMIDKKSNKSGSSDEAELIVTITTGRNVIPYGLVIGILIIGLITFIVIRNKNKK